MATVSAENLKKLVDRALKDETYANRIFTEPEAVAKEAGLSDGEALVVRSMSPELFEQARKDAAKATATEELTEGDLAGVVGGATTTTLSTTTSMIIGRSLTTATGGTYTNLSAAACGCCGWAGSISTGGMLTLPAG